MSADEVSYDEVIGALLIAHRADRLDVYLDEYIDRVPYDDHLRLIVRIWTDTESVYENQDRWDDLWEEIARGRERARAAGEPTDWTDGLLMTPEELKVFEALPDPVEIHRGYRGADWDGHSWTLSREKAEWFARRYEMIYGAGRVASGKVPRSGVVAYLNDRQEDEIIVVRDAVTDVTVTEMTLD